MIEELNGRIADLNGNPGDIAWRAIYWADVLAPRQKEYLRAANRDNDLDFIGVRGFVISILSDASAYRKVDSPQNTTYGLIHDRVREGIADLNSKLDDPGAPLIIMAHSMGGHIMSNYIWDMQHAPGDRPRNLSPFERLHTLAGMITFGCNIPLFTFAYTKVEPIQFPAPDLPRPGGVRDKAKWLNYFDPDDVLGYPLKSINTAYDAVVDEDIAINVGGLLSNWNFLSHTKYWTDNDFTKPAAEFIESFL